MAVGAGMLGWTWGTWLDVLVDFGRELYLPWQITEGRRLYADLASFNGPLSPYLNALWFQLFGVGLRSLVIGNVALLGALTLSLYIVLRNIADSTAAFAGTLLFLLLFAFGEYYEVGNYNYVTPYAHELVHGIVLSFIALCALLSYLRVGSRSMLAMSAVCLGLTFLTKPEVFGASVVALLVGMVLGVQTREPTGLDRAAAVALFIVGTLAPPAIAVAWLTAVMPFETAVRGVLSPYVHVLDPSMAALPFYRELTGLDEPWRSTLAMFAAATAMAALLAAFIALAAAAARRRIGIEVAIFGGLALFAAGIIGNRAIVGHLARPLPLVVAVALGLSAVSLRRQSTNGGAGIAIGRIAFLTFALLLTSKMALNVQIYRYGFALAMPAFMVLVCGLLSWIPSWLDRRGDHGGTFRSLAGASLVTVAVVFLLVHHERFAALATPVGNGPDRFQADGRALTVNAMLSLLAERVGPDEHVTVVPEGVMLNYLARRASSVPYPNFMPPEFVMFGTLAIEDAFASSPPEYLVVVDRPVREYGSAGFGVDYGQGLMAWVQARYHEVASIPGAASMKGPNFAMRLLERNGHER